jgi:hypothetical protein
MTPHGSFLADVPVEAVLDVELVAFDSTDGLTSLICECLLQGQFR